MTICILMDQTIKTWQKYMIYMVANSGYQSDKVDRIPSFNITFFLHYARKMFPSDVRIPSSSFPHTFPSVSI